ncbi:MAG: Bro-N domain-containing protein [Eubacteriales bacterium]|jgi:prophage antirepressor-like protein
MNKLQIFNYNELPVRTVIKEDEPWWIAKDVCDILELGDTSKAVSRLDDDEKDTNSILTPGGNQEMLTVNEPGLYSLILGSRKPEAKQFKRWITHEVLPEIRKAGAYITNQANPEMLRKKADEIESLSTLNEAAKIILPILEEAGLKPQYRALALRQIYRKGGLDLPIEELKAEKAIFDLTTIAKAVGLYSAAGKPHGQAVGAIVSRLDISPDEKEIVTFERNGHSGTANQYTKSVIEKVDCWIKNQGYPSEIPFTDSKGNNRTFSLKYSPSEKI